MSGPLTLRPGGLSLTSKHNLDAEQDGLETAVDGSDQSALGMSSSLAHHNVTHDSGKVLQVIRDVVDSVGNVRND